MTAAGEVNCWRVRRDPDGLVTGGLEPFGHEPLASGRTDDVLVRVEAAGFNYKDALCCAGHAGVMRIAPLVPGIDAAGVVVSGGTLAAGTAVVATGHGLGETRDGGFAGLVRAPVSAVIPRPASLSAEAAMAMGTAGLTALLACDRLAELVVARHAVPGEAWLVTGASGGVGMLAVAVLASAGRRVVACSRKPAAADALRALGAADVVLPEAIRDPTPKSLVKGRWAGVVDTVGGTVLADVLRAVRPGGAVAAIGMAAGADLLTTVHPFILRGVTLAGIDAASLPTPDERAALWQRLALLWPQVSTALPVTRLRLAEVGDHGRRMLAGETSGRGVVIPE
jgi:putative YhdH/YhfP family quinone oxidoreductase